MASIEELQAILLRALQDTSQVYMSHVENPAEYVAEGKEHLLSHLLNPAIPATAIPQAHARSCKVTLDRLDAFALAHDSNSYSWLLYSSADGLFWLAWGTDPADLQLSGFSGTDALEVWLC